MKNLESKIKGRLTEKGLTIQRLATESGISEPTIHAILNRGDAKLSQLKKISEVLGLELHFLLSDAYEASTAATGAIGSANAQKVKASKAPAQDLAQQLDSCQREVESLKQQLALTNALVAAKEETIILLRGNYNRPT